MQVISSQRYYVAHFSPPLHSGHFDNSAMDTAEDLDSINVSRTLIQLRNWVTVGQVQPVKT